MRTTTRGCIVLLAFLGWGAGPAETQFARDNEVMTAVLRDLLSYKGEDSPLHPPFGPQLPLPFASDPWYGEISTKEILERVDEKPWEVLTKLQVIASQQAARDLVQRSKRQVRDFSITEPGIGQWDATQERSEAQSLFDRPIRAFPPGYSTNRRLAIVRLTIPWSLHVAYGTYVVSFKSGTWKVLVRQYAYLL